MDGWLGHLDALLRGEKTHRDALRSGRLELPVSRSIGMALLLAGCYGATMGLFAVTNERADAYLQVAASAVKLPGLFLLTLVVTYPSLYVFSVLAGCRLRFMDVLRLLLAAITVTTAVAASLAPILAFFTLSTTSYSFMVLLNVALLAVAGIVGLGFLHRALAYLMGAVLAADPPRFDAPPATPGEAASALDPNQSSRHRQLVSPAPQASTAVGILRVWLLIYCLVGAQMGWLLRPFIGAPDLKFTLFRVRESNFFHSALEHMKDLMGG